MKRNQNNEESQSSNEEEKDDLKASDETANQNLNELILKRMDFLMNKAKTRNGLSGTLHEERVKDIREGKFKICVPAVTLVFKYLIKMFVVIKETMKDSITNKEKKSFKKFMIYASKFSLISEVLFASFYANENDIYYKDLDQKDWEDLFSVYDYYEPEDLDKFSKQYKTLCEFLGIKIIN